MGIFLEIYTRTTPNSCFCTPFIKITIFYKIYVFCNFFTYIFYYISSFKSFHSLTMENCKTSYFLYKYFFVLQTLMVPFFQQETLQFLFHIFFSLLFMRVELRRKLIRPFQNVINPWNNFILLSKNLVSRSGSLVV